MMRMARRTVVRSLLGCGLIMLSANSSMAQIRQAEVVVVTGDVLPGLSDPVVDVHSLSLNGVGQIGFAGSFGPDPSNVEYFFWAAGQLQATEPDRIFYADQGTGGGFGYVSGQTSQKTLKSQNGVVISEGDIAPFVVPEMDIFRLYRQEVTDDGRQFLQVGLEATGGPEKAAAIYESPTATAGDYQLVVRTGDSFPGSNTATGGTVRGLSHLWDLSSNGQHSLFVENDNPVQPSYWGLAVIVDGVFVARSGEATPDGDAWDVFSDIPGLFPGSAAISNEGDWVVSGRTNAAEDNNEIMVFNNQFVLREGEIVDGTTLGTPLGVDVSQSGKVAHMWIEEGSETRRLYYSPTGNLYADSQLLLSEGDLIDTDGDGQADWTIEGLYQLVIADGGPIYVSATLFFQGSVDAILAVEVPMFTDGFESGDMSAWN